jgi:hypothetical protein
MNLIIPALAYSCQEDETEGNKSNQVCIISPVDQASVLRPESC